MYQSGKPIRLWSAVALGMGAMIGAGIFALLGQAGAIASSAVYLSFLLGGGIALLSGYSLAKLGARYPSAGGVVEYLVQGFGEGVFSGAMSLMLYIAALVSLALVARTFGSYAATFFPAADRRWLVPLMAAIIVLALMLVNLKGARDVARLENTVVAIKVAVLVLFALAGLWFIRPELLAPRSYPPPRMIFFSLAVTFFAYEGFRVITNTAEDMADPARLLPRSMFTAIGLVMALYVAVALAVFGNLPAQEAVQARDFALAQAALPAFGQTGFTVVALAALVSTASAINAGLYSVTNISYQMAKNGELPAALARPIGHSREGLVVSSVFIAGLAVFFDLSEIAAIGSISILFIHAAVHAGHLRRLAQTGASPVLVAAALLATGTAIVLALIYESVHAPYLVYTIAVFMLGALAGELVLRFGFNRIVKARIRL